MARFHVLVPVLLLLGVVAEAENAAVSSEKGYAAFSDEQGRTNSKTKISISLGATIQDVVNAHPAGTTFVLQAGIFRMQSVVPKSGDTFEGTMGTVLNGSRQLTSFSRSGAYWIAGGQTQHGTANGRCLPAHRGCQYPEDLFFNNVPLQRVESLAEIATGKWYFDYPAGSVYFVDDPTGKTVEISTMTHAFSGSATNVTIKGLTIEKYAAPAQDGAISCYDVTNVCLAKGWTIESNEIRLNHGAAIRLANNLVIRSNYIHHNGQEGLTGSGDNILVRDNEIAYNNTLGFDFGWEAGGTKFSNTADLIVEGNYVHDNKGPGLSLDYQTYNWLVEGNRTSGNWAAGILDEIGYDGTARYDIIVEDGFYPDKANASMWYGCGIQIDASRNAMVYGNTLINNSNGICAISNSRGSGNRGPFLVQNLSVHDNVIVQSVGSATGAVADGGSFLDVYSNSWNNRWTANTYKFSNSGNFHVWKGGASYVSMDASHWQSFGQDTAGTWILSSDSTFPSTKFSAREVVTTSGSTEVWSLPTRTSTIVTTEAPGMHGKVTKVAGPIRTDGAWWWSVEFDDGKAGWCEEKHLATL